MSNEEVQQVDDKKETDEKVFVSFDDVLKVGVIQNPTVKKQVEWENKNTGDVNIFDVFIRKHSFHVFEKLILGKDGDGNADLSRIVSECIATDETGTKKLLTYKQVCNLEPSLGFALVNAINEVNGADNNKETKKN